MQIRLGISTCPNDTFAFAGLIERRVDWRGFEFVVELLDIERLNEGITAGRFDVAKCSFHAALRWTDRYVVLPSGSALGFGVGPVVLSKWAKPSVEHSDDNQPRVNLRQLAESLGRRPTIACPGEMTTATLLWRLFGDGDCELQQVVFSDIVPMLQSDQVDVGVCIHEGRFTWQGSGLHCLADLGELWETSSQQPLPLGGLVGRADLGPELLLNVNRVIRDSILAGRANVPQALPIMRKYAQEFSDDVLLSHVDLYVNEQTVDLGTTGRTALAHLAKTANESGAVEISLEGIDRWLALFSS